MKKNYQKKLMIGVLLFSLWANVMSAAAAQLTVSADTAKIRAEASTSSEVVGSTEKGKTFPSEGEATDSSGMLWYRIAVGNNAYGYIRSDLVEVSGDSGSSDTTAETTETSAAEPPATVPTAIGEVQATISNSDVVVRSGASTSHSRITSLPSGTQITLIGEATDSSGKLWYQMRCTYNNREITGYVRYDLISTTPSEGSTDEGEQSEDTTSEADPAEDGDDGAGDEGPAGTSAAPADETGDQAVLYEVHYEANEVGEYEYNIYDNEAGVKYNVPDLISLRETVEQTTEKYEGQVRNGRIIIIILAVLIVALALIVAVLFFKIRDLYNDYDEDEEEEEEDDDDFRRNQPAGRMNRDGDRRGDPRSGQRQPRPASDQESRPPRSSQSSSRQPQSSSRQQITVGQGVRETRNFTQQKDPVSRPAPLTGRAITRPENRRILSMMTMSLNLNS